MGVCAIVVTWPEGLEVPERIEGGRISYGRPGMGRASDAGEEGAEVGGGGEVAGESSWMFLA